MKCIFCLKEKNSSDEHIFPEAIGGHLIFYEVCSDCNKLLGRKVDHHLSNCFFIKAKKTILGLHDKNGEIPDIFGTVPMVDNPDIKIHTTISEIGRPLRIKVLPYINKTFEANILKKINFHGDQSESDNLFIMVNKSLKREKLTQLSRDDFEKNITHKKISNPVINKKFITGINNIGKSIAKISYELAYFLWGSDLLNDKHYNRIREWLIFPDDIDSDEISDRWLLVEFYTDQMENIFDDKQNHVALFGTNPQKELICSIRIFDTYYAKVRLTDCISLKNIYSNPIIVNDTISKNLIIFDLFTEMRKGTLYKSGHV